MTERLPRLRIGQGRHFGPISLFPIWVETPEVHGLGPADESGVRAAERDGSPVVGELVLTNPSLKPVLLLAGELFEGGWQHRALNHDLVLGAGRRVVASVSCVEAGRWQGAHDQVHRSRRASICVRAAQLTAVEGVRQREVWNRVSRYDAVFGASETSSYVEHLNRRSTANHAPTQRPAAIPAQHLQPLAGQRGVIVGLGGQPALLELFPSTQALGRHLPALIESLSLDAALSGAEPTPGRRARRLVERLEWLRLVADVTRDAGEGQAVAGHTAYHHAAGVVWRDQLAHATVFNQRHPLVAA